MTRIHSRLAAVLAVLMMTVFSVPTMAEITMKEVEYQHGDQKLIGYVVKDDSIKEDRPGILVIHQWTGITKHEKNFAKKLAKLGYVAFVADIYGYDKKPKDRSEAKVIATKFRGGDRKLLQDRAMLALATMKQLEGVDENNTAALGFCFGGTTVLEMARIGADTKGVISFHGNLHTPKNASADTKMPKILVAHGAADAIVPMEEVNAFIKEMDAAKADYQFISYSGAVHGFTHDYDPKRYQKEAADRSFKHMLIFFDEIFAEKKAEKPKPEGSITVTEVETIKLD